MTAFHSISGAICHCRPPPQIFFEPACNQVRRGEANINWQTGTSVTKKQEVWVVLSVSVCVCVCCTGKGWTGKGRAIRETLRAEKSHLLGKRHHRSQTQTRNVRTESAAGVLHIIETLQNHARLTQISFWQTSAIPAPPPKRNFVHSALHLQ